MSSVTAIYELAAVATGDRTSSSGHLPAYVREGTITHQIVATVIMATAANGPADSVHRENWSVAFYGPQTIAAWEHGKDMKDTGKSYKDTNKRKALNRLHTKL